MYRRDQRLRLSAKFELLEDDPNSDAKKGHHITLEVYTADKFKEALLVNATLNRVIEFTETPIEYLNTLKYFQVTEDTIIEEAVKRFIVWVYKYRLEYRLNNFKRLYMDYQTKGQ